ncbi:MAG: hypothetical protein SFW67_00275 [Myxococcaceae bacterium]|nr:hypothetical protein [Myxococcaceae bacterium]
MRWLVVTALLLTGAPALAAPVKGKKAAPARAPEPEVSHLAKARELSKGFEFDAALTELEFARAQKPSADELVEIETLTALAWAALDDLDKSAKAFSQLLKLRPDFTPGPSVSPKVRDAFSRGRALYESTLAVTLEAAPPVTGDDGSVSFEVKVTAGERRVSELTLAWRLADGPPALEQLGFLRTGPAAYAVKLPPLRQGEARRAQLEYSVRARDVGGAVVATLGTPDSPQRLEVSVLAVGPAAVPLYKSWAFWTVVGVVAVGAAVGTPLAINAVNTPPVPQGSLGQVQLK